ncbi:GATOR2 complex protein WDR59 isoform X2 [Hetaerina americana]|uniref:GATOR2 complex protein WDR59 isoform X2 n=1 Tax=Hetaerina americana TaxID=62018 RepID=UPI003A7F1101
MARWNNDFVVAEHRDVQACAMGVDYSGDFALLAGYKCLALVCLEDPTEIVRTISRPYKDDVKIVQWNQTSDSKEICALSNNHRVEILRWRLGEGVGCIGELLGDHISLDSHSRAVSGLDWHKVEPYIIATGSGDGWLHVWDIREHRYPSISFSSVALVTKVRWNRVNGNLIASAHDGDIRLWDRRKSSSPLHYITAHVGEIHDLDWSAIRESELVTCGGQDCSVRFFDVWRPENPKAFLATASPVWRARHAPFGEGLVTSVSSSQQQQESSGNVLLWRRCRGGDESSQEPRSKPCSSSTMATTASPARRHSTPAASPLHTISSHSDIVLDFQWRKNREEPTNYELVTWSMDQILGIWRIDPMFQKLCGYEPDVESLPELPDCCATPEIAITVPQKEVDELSSSASKENLAKKDGGGKCIEDRGKILKEEGEAGHILNGVCSEADSHPVGHHALSGNEPSSPSTVVWETKAKLICRVESTSEEEIGAEAKADECTSYSDTAAETPVIGSVHNNMKSDLETSSTCSGDPSVASSAGHVPSVGPPVMTDKQQHPGPTQSAIPLPPPLPHLMPPVLESSTPYGGGFQDSFVPFPQTSGARFSSAGFLVCFARPSASRCPWSTADAGNNTNGSAFSSSSSTSSTASYAGATSVVHSTPTPRSLSALGGASIGTVLGVVPNLSTGNSSTVDHHHSAFCSPRDVSTMQKSGGKSLKTGQSMRHKAYGNKERGDAKSGGERGSARGWALVTIYDASKLLYLHKELGEQYIFDPKDVPGMCITNANVAASVGRKDLVQVWTLASLSASCFLAHRNQSSHPLLGTMSRALSAGNWMGIAGGLLEDDEEQRNPLEEDLTDSEEDIPWSHHPLGRPFIESMISYYASQYDLQTAAMLCCAFGNQNELQPVGEKKKSYGVSSGISSNKSITISPGGSPYHTVHPGGGGIGGVGVSSESGTGEGWLEGGWGALAPILKQNRSNSWSDSLDDMRSAAAAIVEHREAGGRATHNPRLTSLHHTQHQIWQGGGMLSTRGQLISGYRDRNVLTLDNSKRLLYDEYKNEYSEILNRWHLLEARAQVLKYVSVPLEPHRGVEFLTDCQHCSRSVRGAHCSYCKRLSLLCVICHVSVKGCSNFCLICGHGGHSNHIQDWFRNEDTCPSGCGCKCTEQSAAILD